MPWVDFDREAVFALNPTAPILELSCRDDQGLDAWIDWLCQRRLPARS